MGNTVNVSSHHVMGQALLFSFTFQDHPIFGLFTELLFQHRVIHDPFLIGL